VRFFAYTAKNPERPLATNPLPEKPGGCPPAGEWFILFGTGYQTPQLKQKILYFYIIKLAFYLQNHDITNSWLWLTNR